MNLIFKLIFGAVLGMIAGYAIDKLSRKFIDETEDRLKDYKLNRVVIISAMVVLTIADILIFDWIGLIKYSLVGFILILIGIIDHYTHYVYLIIALPGIILALVIGIYFNGIYTIIYLIPLFLILFIVAYFGNKFYGDIEALIIIGFSFGLVSIVGLTAVAIILSVGEILNHLKKKKEYSIAFCAYLALAYVTVHIGQIILLIN